MCGVAAAQVPATPTTLANTTGDCWINHTWAVGAGIVTNSYNVSVNNVWYNTTTDLFYKGTYNEDSWQNITVWAYNITDAGNLSAAAVSENTRVTGCAFNFASIVILLNQLPDILDPIPDILAALAEVAIYGAVIGLAIGIVYSLRRYIEKLLKF